MATPDGKLLAYDHFHPNPQRFLALLERGEKQGKPARNAAFTLTNSASLDGQYARRPPAGGLILNVFSRIPLPPPPGKTWTPNQATGRDHFWITRNEWRALLPAEWKTGVRYALPQAVTERLLRFHLVDNVRGEPDFWRRADLRAANLTLRVADARSGRLVLEGTARMEHGGERGYEARLQGYLAYDKKQDRLTRFDLLAWGDAWGEGRYTRGAPSGRFPLVVAASLAGNGGADSQSGADRVPPQASRDLSGYLGTGRAER